MICSCGCPLWTEIQSDIIWGHMSGHLMNYESNIYSFEKNMWPLCCSRRHCVLYQLPSKHDADESGTKTGKLKGRKPKHEPNDAKVHCRAEGKRVGWIY